ncbi:hypothetical protein BIV25_37360 [Streptomyces sp. MUSC 14]|uniref:hypothetical protein n=1 Tax=Streptomyces sp. MUSC 14 TaxID=1354889 RepID=UPI0008F5D8D5|nr:hypothetical protein [Streptomyces sp. MUSC 14]OIJ88172.1 hypothetical protein BIV25_37360 [Streptomyces sp. MUSC 14]
MSAAVGRVGRFYTAARRHPWVLGKVADWKIPLGPYTPAQIAVAVGGGFLLVKTISWWSWMGPVPPIAWILAIWAVRRPKIRGRAPMQAAVGWVLLGWQPRGGRIGGRAARDRGPRPLLGGFTIEGAPVPEPAPSHATQTPHPHPATGRTSTRVRKSVRRRSAPTAPAAAMPVSGVQQLLASVGQGGAR